MGVQGLWQLLTPIARPINLDSLGNKRLAIDSSIWLYQFQLAIRDKNTGTVLNNAHILGFLRRISKLLYYGIKPVFVFDGGAPILKKKTIAGRKDRKKYAQESLAKTAEKLLAAQMRKAALKDAQKRQLKEQTGDIIDEDAVYLEDLGSTSGPLVHGSSSTRAAASAPQGSTSTFANAATSSNVNHDDDANPSPSKKRKYVHLDEYELPVISSSNNGGGGLNPFNSTTTTTSGGITDPRLATEEELRDFIEEMNPSDFDLDSNFFSSLPTTIKYEIIGDLRLKSRQVNYKRVEEMKKNSFTDLDFSKRQIENLKERDGLTKKLLRVTDTVGKSHVEIEVNRVVGQRNREYVLIKNSTESGGGWSLGLRDGNNNNNNNNEGQEGGLGKTPIVIDDIDDGDDDDGENIKQGSDDDDGDEDDDDLHFEEVKIPEYAEPELENSLLSKNQRQAMALHAIRRRYAPNHPTTKDELDFDFDFDPYLLESTRVAWKNNKGKGKGKANDKNHHHYGNGGGGGGGGAPLFLSSLGNPNTRESSRGMDSDDVMIGTKSSRQQSSEMELDSTFAAAIQAEEDERLAAELQAQETDSFKPFSSSSTGPSYLTKNASSSIPSPPSKEEMPLTQSFPLFNQDDDDDDLYLPDPVLPDRIETVHHAPETAAAAAAEAEIEVEDSDSNLSFEEVPSLSTSNPPLLPSVEPSSSAPHQPTQSIQTTNDGDELRPSKHQRIGTSKELEEKETFRYDVLDKTNSRISISPVLLPRLSPKQAPTVRPSTSREAEKQSVVDLDDDDDDDDGPATTRPSLTTDLSNSTKKSTTTTRSLDPNRDSVMEDISQTITNRIIPASESPPASPIPLNNNKNKNKNDDDDASIIADTSQALRTVPTIPASPPQVTTTDKGKGKGKRKVDDIIYDDFESDEEVYSGWSKSPSPPSRSPGGKNSPPPPPKMGVAINKRKRKRVSDENDGDVEEKEEEEEEEEVEDYDVKAQEDMEEEQKHYAEFYSELKSRRLDEMREEIDAEIDGLEARHKVDKRDADDVTQQMAREVQTLLRLFGLPYVVAPMEAEAQCAQLLSQSLVDGIITDDSDVFLFGGSKVYKNMFNQAKHVELYQLSDLEREMGLDRGSLVRLAHFLGSDYADGIKGVGPVMGMELMKEFPGRDGLSAFRKWWRRVQTGKDGKDETDKSKFRKRFKKRHKDTLFLEDDWPNPAIAQAYYEPSVDGSAETFSWGFPDLDALRTFLGEHLGWSTSKSDEVLLPLIKRITQRRAGVQNIQGTLNSFFDNAGGGGGAFLPRKQVKAQSARLQAVIKEWRKIQARQNTNEDDIVGHSDEENDSGQAVPEEDEFEGGSAKQPRTATGRRTRKGKETNRAGNTRGGRVGGNKAGRGMKGAIKNGEGIDEGTSLSTSEPIEGVTPGSGDQDELTVPPKRSCQTPRKADAGGRGQGIGRRGRGGRGRNTGRQRGGGTVTKNVRTGRKETDDEGFDGETMNEGELETEHGRERVEELAIVPRERRERKAKVSKKRYRDEVEDDDEE